MGPQFDLDNEVEGLSGQVGKLKNVSQGVPVCQYNPALVEGLILRLMQASRNFILIVKAV